MIEDYRHLTEVQIGPDRIWMLRFEGQNLYNGCETGVAGSLDDGSLDFVGDLAAQSEELIA